MEPKEDEKPICSKCHFEKAITTLGNDKPICWDCFSKYSYENNWRSNDPGYLWHTRGVYYRWVREERS